MLRSLVTAIAIVGIWLSGSSIAAITAHGAAFNLTDPVRLSAIRYYLDGGTVGFTLVDAREETLRGGFDGRMQEIGSVHQRHCYVGDEHPTGPHARFLPLWGSEERDLVRLLRKALNDSLPSERIERLLSTTTAMELPEDSSVELWHIVRVVEDRGRTHEAMDRGLLSSPEAAVRYFEVAVPIRADSIGLDRASERFVVRIRDARAKELRVSFPASTDSVMSPSSDSWPVLSTWQYHSAGTTEDRLLMTLIFVALDGSSTSGNALGVSSAEYQRHRATVLGLMKVRTAGILEADAKD